MSSGGAKLVIWQTSSGSTFASDWLNGCVLGTGSLRICVAAPSISRAGGLAAITPPMTSFSTSICGSHGASANGDRMYGREVLPAGGVPGTCGLGVCAACCCCAALSAASIACRLIPENSLANCRSTASSTESRSAPAASRAKVATTSSFAACSIALRTLVASCLSA